MELLMIVLRLVHVVSGVLWVGMAVFTTIYLAPAVQDAGPEGGKVMAALQRRGVMTVMPLFAIATLLSGIGLYWRVSGGFRGSFVMSGPGLGYGLGGLAAIAAYAVGMTVARPSMLRAAALMQQMASAGDAGTATREATMAEVAQLRARSGAAGRLVVGLLVLAVAAMAVARYL